MTRAGAHLALVLAAAFWGFGNIAQKTVLDFMGPFTATGLRCGIAALALVPLALLEARSVRQRGWWPSALGVAAVFAAAIGLQQTAYIAASVTNASFLVNTATVLTPLIAWLLLGEVTGRLGIFAAGLTLVGVFLMSNAIDGFAALNWGDVACLASALFYALWMVALGRHAQRYGLPFSCALAQFAVCALLALPVSLLFEEITPASIAAAAPHLAILGLFATAAAFSLQTVAQRYTTASRAAVLVSGESIFGAVGAYTVLNERPALPVAIGAAIIFAAILLVALSPAPAAPPPATTVPGQPL